ncbi:alpha-1,4-glucan branching enzyme [Pycnococcus provasolii]|uniref:1,4-alpha-glucan branching enzyme n=2 Tax=Pycnococcus provasolii TaxID=41880 RepID=A0A830HJK4_9CHLO|nr:alpha-1,4-glucan branching enzyme [Pycnococcus provasolii]
MVAAAAAAHSVSHAASHARHYRLVGAAAAAKRKNNRNQSGRPSLLGRCAPSANNVSADASSTTTTTTTTTTSTSYEEEDPLLAEIAELEAAATSAIQELEQAAVTSPENMEEEDDEEDISALAEELENFKLADLRNIARSYGIKLTGKKSELIERIVAFTEQQEQEDDEEGQDDDDDDDDVDDDLVAAAIAEADAAVLAQEPSPSLEHTTPLFKFMGAFTGVDVVPAPPPPPPPSQPQPQAEKKDDATPSPSSHLPPLFKFMGAFTGVDSTSASASAASSSQQPTPQPQHEFPTSSPSASSSSGVRFEQVHVDASVQTSGDGIARMQMELGPYSDALKHRHHLYCSMVHTLSTDEGGLDTFSASGYERFGLHQVGEVVLYTEWAPRAQQLSLVGDFNDWDEQANVGEVDSFGVWTVRVPASQLKHGMRVRTCIETQEGERFTRIPAYVRATAPEATGKPYLDGIFYNPPAEEEYVWQNERPARDGRRLKIYEAHIGMSGEEAKVSTFKEFKEKVVPQVAKLGYTAIQIMGVAEHALYASFGYQVTSFFAPSHRFGTPEDLKELVDSIHGHGMVAMLDVVHAHASSNTQDGLNMFDGSDAHYFHPDPQRGYHSDWGTRVFDYGNRETLRFLLSNLRYWVQEFGFDGFRFDGVTSMLYHHHGIRWSFLGGTSEYFDSHWANEEAIVYMKLANTLVRSLLPDSWSITVCEDVSAFPGSTGAVATGGLGFDYRLAMHIPDEFMSFAKATYEMDDGAQFHPSRVAGTLLNRRARDATVAYVESHDQAMVGGQSFMFALADLHMYDGMNIDSENRFVYRGCGLHKTIRFATLCLGGDAYMTFMGNEFGHPEWIDFPSEANGQSHEKARRQWSLRDPSAGLKYAGLEAWDGAMLDLETEFALLGRCTVTRVDDETGLLVWEAGNGELVCVANLKGAHLYDARVGVQRFGEYNMRLDSDAPGFAGSREGEYGRAFASVHSDAHIPWDGQDCSLTVHDIPPWSVQVFKLDPDTERSFIPVTHYEHHDDSWASGGDYDYIDDSECYF